MTHYPSLELWAGVECTVARIGDDFVDQILRTGHEERLEDLDRLADLGVRAIRYPVLWERTAPLDGARPDFTWADERLGRIAKLGLRPIVGLVHHGSGPRHTSLLEPSFVEGLASFAGVVAVRYPEIEDYTPINEPLTTARFSGLYGHWYPHARSTPTFVRALLNECHATRRAMQAIRAINPRARLVQTEDLGRIFSTPALAYQARFENLRRFLSLDLLTGRVGPGHPLRSHLLENGATERELDTLVADPCPPDIIGVNYYLTSDRFLDDRVERYPAGVHGGNGRHVYADVEAVRVRGAGIVGHAALLSEVWDRFGIPLAVTEVHLGCAPEEQVRWLAEAWEEAERARRAGVDVRAITAWSAFGAYDWNSLLVRSSGSYEPGLFDIRGGHVRPTAVADAARSLARSGTVSHPIGVQPGWWRRPERLLYPPFGEVEAARAPELAPVVLVTGGNGRVGSAIARACRLRGLSAVVLSRSDLDVSHAGAVENAFATYRPWAIVNAAGYTDVDRAERDIGACYRDNVVGPETLAAACALHGVRLLTFSSSLVFDGKKGELYLEGDHVGPLSVYGAAQADAERRVLDLHPDALVARTATLFDVSSSADFVSCALEELDAAHSVRAPGDAIISATYLPDLVEAVLTLLVDGGSGVFHLSNAGAVSWAELAHAGASAAGVPTEGLVACAASELDLAARRPRYAALGSERSALMPSLDQALSRFGAAWRAGRAA